MDSPPTSFDITAERKARARGVFPHRLSWFLDLPWRRLVLSRRQLVERLALTPGKTVLEVGPGSGYYSVALATTGAYLTLLDLQPEMLRKARRHARGQGSQRVGYAAADAAHLPILPQSFDVVLMVTVFGEIHAPKSFLNEARRVLRPDGILSISEHIPDPDFTAFRSLAGIVEAAGFELVAKYGVPWSYTANFTPSIPHR